MLLKVEDFEALLSQLRDIRVGPGSILEKVSKCLSIIDYVTRFRRGLVREMLPEDQRLRCSAQVVVLSFMERMTRNLMAKLHEVDSLVLDVTYTIEDAKMVIEPPVVQNDIPQEEPSNDSADSPSVLR